MLALFACLAAQFAVQFARAQDPDSVPYSPARKAMGVLTRVLPFMSFYLHVQPIHTKDNATVEAETAHYLDIRWHSTWHTAVGVTGALATWTVGLPLAGLPLLYGVANLYIAAHSAKLQQFYAFKATTLEPGYVERWFDGPSGGGWYLPLAGWLHRNPSMPIVAMLLFLYVGFTRQATFGKVSWWVLAVFPIVVLSYSQALVEYAQMQQADRDATRDQMGTVCNWFMIPFHRQVWLSITSYFSDDYVGSNVIDGYIINNAYCRGLRSSLYAEEKTALDIFTLVAIGPFLHAFTTVWRSVTFMEKVQIAGFATVIIYGVNVASIWAAAAAVWHLVCGCGRSRQVCESVKPEGEPMDAISVAVDVADDVEEEEGESEESMVAADIGDDLEEEEGESEGDHDPPFVRADEVTPEDVLDKVTLEDVLDKVTPEDVLDKVTLEDVLDEVTPEDVLDKVKPGEAERQILPVAKEGDGGVLGSDVPAENDGEELSENGTVNIPPSSEPMLGDWKTPCLTFDDDYAAFFDKPVDQDLVNEFDNLLLKNELKAE